MGNFSAPYHCQRGIPLRSEILDLLIIGAGPTGLSAADEATKLGLKRVVVLERESEAGWRATPLRPFGFRFSGFQASVHGTEVCGAAAATWRRIRGSVRTRGN